MADQSKIEWTDATWNPVRGCAIVSPGCTNCYAMKQAHRFSGPGKPYDGLTKLTKGGPVWTGKVRVVPELLREPLRWKRPRRIFVNSMSDLFHEDVPDEFIGAVFGVMAQCPQHTFQVLTKRATRMLAWFTEEEPQHASLREWCFYAARDLAGKEWMPIAPWTQRWPLRNVWLGVSVEDQRRADERIPLLLQTPAAVRWISAEPLLGPISFEGCWIKYKDPAIHENWLERLDWVVVGGESGHRARPFDVSWARSLRDQCKALGVPFFLKQLGRYPFSDRDEGYPWAQLYNGNDKALKEWGLFDGPSSKGGDPADWPADLRVREYPA